MSQLIEIKVPDIGDYKDIPVIEVHIKPGDTIEKEQSLVTLESDKATMEVPADQAGKVISVSVCRPSYPNFRRGSQGPRRDGIG